jgi:large subunit ribosomal protein L6
MSKIGRKPIDIGNAKVEVRDNEVHFQGKKASGLYAMPLLLTVKLEDKKLYVSAVRKGTDVNRLWGLHRSLLANKIKGADTGFEKQVRIVGLGFKAVPAGKNLQFSLGYSHKIDFPLPEGIAVDIDKTGQLLTFRSADKELLGSVCSEVRDLRLPEPYKGTGIQYVGEVIMRKAGKAKAA